jgi:hypothetical protein
VLTCAVGNSERRRLGRESQTVTFLELRSELDHLDERHTCLGGKSKVSGNRQHFFYD